MSLRASVLLPALLAFCVGCAFVPQKNLRLDDAQRAHAEALADPAVARLAPAELQTAADILDRAGAARDTLQDAALVDHLSYLARQRVAIAREAARLRR